VTPASHRALVDAEFHPETATALLVQAARERSHQHDPDPKVEPTVEEADRGRLQPTSAALPAAAEAETAAIYVRRSATGLAEVVPLVQPAGAAGTDSGSEGLTRQIGVESEKVIVQPAIRGELLPHCLSTP
jgi:hypothetical protein